MVYLHYRGLCPRYSKRPELMHAHCCDSCAVLLAWLRCSMHQLVAKAREPRGNTARRSDSVKGALLKLLACAGAKLPELDTSLQDVLAVSKIGMDGVSLQVPAVWQQPDPHEGVGDVNARVSACSVCWRHLAVPC